MTALPESTTSASPVAELAVGVWCCSLRLSCEDTMSKCEDSCSESCYFQSHTSVSKALTTDMLWEHVTLTLLFLVTTFTVVYFVLPCRLTKPTYEQIVSDEELPTDPSAAKEQSESYMEG